ncbi:ATP synthase subunit b 2 [Iodidimonas nitroreducens]|uniref:ATP synthase subunit b n=1 Tax=Iodidimonas nitroreducens TaxID=1236968 RepID=A0A5A7N7V1_9PROT|nr:hypothetical protein [Iodidimonas nitroreducens]GAK33593.1 ATP synthase subunit b 2 [alpha proteobacterium Q-1]GER03715.1 ATP synthase subunit b 2 [Iodidimonas nitroreducens]
MPQFDPALFAPQIIWLMIAFGVLWLVMARIGLPRVERTMVERSEQIEADLDAARQMSAKSDELTAAYEATLSEARAKAAAIAERTKADIRQRTDQLMAETQAKLDARMVETQAEIDKEFRSALSEVDGVAAEVAASIIARLAGEELAAKDLEAVVSQVRSEAA